jgi:hypothetical protein
MNCEACRDTGYVPSGLELKGMRAGEEPRMEVKFKPCTLGCPKDLKKVKEVYLLDTPAN